MLLHEILIRAASRDPDGIAVIARDEEISFRELAGCAEQFAMRLQNAGLAPGSRVGILLPNCAQFLVAYYGASLAGLQAVPANPALKAAELGYIWSDAEIGLVVTMPPLAAVVAAARVSVPSLNLVLNIDADSLTGFDYKGFPQPAGPLQPSKAKDSDCAVVIYTSGTTGRPKGAMLSHANLTTNVAQVQAALQFSSTDRFLTVLPLFHSFAATVCMNTALAGGCATVLLDTFSPPRTWDTIRKHRISIVAGVPTIFGALLAHRPEAVPESSSVRICVSGGAPLPLDLLDRIETGFGCPVLEGDGPTECSPVTSVNRLDRPRKAGSVGLPVPGVEIAIHDPNGQALPPGERGEIVVRGSNVMLGYLNQPAETADAMRGGWYHTGDIGFIDNEGYVYIVDRLKDMIITMGLNVYPREIEETLMQHPDVAQAAVIGMTDSRRGEAVMAVIVARSGAAAPLRDLLPFCRERLAAYKTPKRFVYRESLPVGSTGKVVKRLLAKELELEFGEAGTSGADEPDQQ